MPQTTIARPAPKSLSTWLTAQDGEIRGVVFKLTGLAALAIVNFVQERCSVIRSISSFIRLSLLYSNFGLYFLD